MTLFLFPVFFFLHFPYWVMNVPTEVRESLWSCPGQKVSVYSEMPHILAFFPMYAGIILVDSCTSMLPFLDKQVIPCYTAKDLRPQSYTNFLPRWKKVGEFTIRHKQFILAFFKLNSITNILICWNIIIELYKILYLHIAFLFIFNCIITNIYVGCCCFGFNISYK